MSVAPLLAGGLRVLNAVVVDAFSHLRLHLAAERFAQGSQLRIVRRERIDRDLITEVRSKVINRLAVLGSPLPEKQRYIYSTNEEAQGVLLGSASRVGIGDALQSTTGASGDIASSVDLDGLKATDDQSVEHLLQSQPSRVFCFDELMRRLKTRTQFVRHGKRADRGLRHRSSSIGAT